MLLQTNPQFPVVKVSMENGSTMLLDSSHTSLPKMVTGTVTLTRATLSGEVDPTFVATTIETGTVAEVPVAPIKEDDPVREPEVIEEVEEVVDEDEELERLIEEENDSE